MAAADTTRVLFAAAAHSGMHVHQVDVKAAYLNATLKKPVYMCPPKGDPQLKGVIWKVQKSLYGLPVYVCSCCKKDTSCAFQCKEHYTGYGLLASHWVCLLTPALAHDFTPVHGTPVHGSTHDHNLHSVQADKWIQAAHNIWVYYLAAYALSVLTV